MNMKQTLISVIVIGLVALTAGAGTYAYFSDTETSVGNTFTAGTMDLKVKHDGLWSDGLTATWTMSDMIPGVSTKYGWIMLRNVGSTSIDHVEISVSNECIEAGTEESDTLPSSADGMDEYLEITYLWYDGKNLLDTLVDQNGNDFIDLDDFEANPIDDLTPVPAPNSGGDQTLEMEIIFHSSAPNDYQGDICEMTMSITVNQDSSQ